VRIGKSAAEVSTRFHQTVIDGCAGMVDCIAASTGLRTVALSGGSFQNAILLRGLINALHKRNYSVLTHTQVPSNDGGIALGQAVIAHIQMKD
jgi:hydrogenase maturation protein HypF